MKSSHTCPNCGQQMKMRSKFESRIRHDPEDFDYEEYYMKVFVYSCKECKIKFKQDEYQDYYGKWELPKEFTPSEKQIDYARNIAHNLGLSTDGLITKQQYWEFINKNTKKYKKYQKEENDRKMEYIAEYVQENGIYDESDFY